MKNGIYLIDYITNVSSRAKFVTKITGETSHTVQKVLHNDNLFTEGRNYHYNNKDFRNAIKLDCNIKDIDVFLYNHPEYFL